MDDQYVIAALVLVVAMVLRIWIVRPHGFGNALFFCAAVYFADTVFSDTVAVYAVVLVSVIMVHKWAKKYDALQKKDAGEVKLKSNGTTQPEAEKKPETESNASAQPESVTIKKSKTEAKTTTQPEEWVSKESNTQSETTVKLKTVAKEKTKVEQTLTTCLRCGKSLEGAVCKHCGFDHRSEPIYFLCLANPRKLQIQTESDNQQ